MFYDYNRETRLWFGVGVYFPLVQHAEQTGKYNTCQRVDFLRNMLLMYLQLHTCMYVTVIDMLCIYVYVYIFVTSHHKGVKVTLC